MRPAKIRRHSVSGQLARLIDGTSAVLCIGMLAACASQSGIAPKATLISAEGDGLIPGARADEPAQRPISDAWWNIWQDGALTRLIDRALAEQPTLRIAQARLESAAALVARNQAALLPSARASADATRERFSANSIYPPPLGGGRFTLANAQLGASWELDWFGKNRASLDAALGYQRAAQADVQAARLLLASNVAQAYVQLARLQAQRELANRVFELRKTMLLLVRQRVEAGLDSSIELRASEGGLPDSTLQIEQIDEQIALARHFLADLCALAPESLDTLQARLPSAESAVLPERIPADLLGRRADIVAAKWRVESAGSGILAARAEFYPDINLIGFAGLASIGLDRLLRSSSQQWGAGAALSLPIFDSGRLRANLKGKTADFDGAVESYNSTVLHAVHEAADELGSLQSVAQQIKRQQEAIRTAQAGRDLAAQRAAAGLSGRLAVLGAEMLVLNQRRQEIDLDARLRHTQIAVIRALGGGYRNPQDDSGAPR